MGRTSGEGAIIDHLAAIETASETTATDGTTRTAAVSTAANQTTIIARLTSILTELQTLNAFFVAVKNASGDQIDVKVIP